jgi:hypothetical protein
LKAVLKIQQTPVVQTVDFAGEKSEINVELVVENIQLVHDSKRRKSVKKR